MSSTAPGNLSVPWRTRRVRIRITLSFLNLQSAEVNGPQRFFALQPSPAVSGRQQLLQSLDHSLRTVLPAQRCLAGAEGGTLRQGVQGMTGKSAPDRFDQ